MNMYRKLSFLNMKWLICIFLFVLASCDDRYRYVCQNPDNFYKAECQKPKCQFTQTCPEYLVAPILEKQIEPAKASSDIRTN